MFESPVLETKLLYSGSKNGFMSKNFHQKCDFHKNTVSLYKLAEDGPCIGGYTMK
jgi:hypothetical protein